MRVWEAPYDGVGPMLALAFFVLAPYALAALAGRLARGRPSGVAALAGSALVCGFGLTVYADALLFSENPVNLLLLLVVPVYQYGLALVALAVVALLRRRETAPPARDVTAARG